VRTWNIVHRDGELFAVYFANSYEHTDQPRDTWIDVILGTWGQNSNADHETFGCRVGPVDNSSQPAASLVTACADGSASPLHGVALTREQGLTHPRLRDFWAVVDLVLAKDPTVRRHLYRE
jgi:hypothetical protein